MTKPSFIILSLLERAVDGSLSPISFPVKAGDEMLLSAMTLPLPEWEDVLTSISGIVSKTVKVITKNVINRDMIDLFIGQFCCLPWSPDFRPHSVSLSWLMFDEGCTQETGNPYCSLSPG